MTLLGTIKEPGILDCPATLMVGGTLGSMVLGLMQTYEMTAALELSKNAVSGASTEVR